MRTVFIALAAVLVADIAAAADKPVVAPPAPWVHPVAVPDDKMLADNQPIQVLLSDQQLNFMATGDSVYTHSVTRIQTAQGLQALGTIKLVWKPEMDSVTIHHILIKRGAEVIDVLAKTKEFTVLRRETGLDYAVLDGNLTTAIQLEGLQVGDIVDIATTDTHFDPVMKSHSSWLLSLQAQLPISRKHTSAEWGKNKSIRWQAIEPMLVGTVIQKGQTINYSADNLPTFHPPKNAPVRFQTGTLLEITDFATWAEVSELFVPLYDAARKLTAGSPLIVEIAKIRALSNDPKLQAAAALALVQEKTRYVLLAMNQGGYVPAAADVTWQRRFGDCKGKTTLLLALLDGLGIRAEPALVNTSLGDGLNRYLPNSMIFDHILVRAIIADKIYWLDGTRYGDRGLDTVRVPPFHWALPLRHKGAALEAIIEQPFDQPQSDETLRLDASAGITQPATAHAERILRGDIATRMKLALAAVPPADLDRMLREDWREKYDFITPTSTSARFDTATGDEHMLMDGTAKMDWGKPADNTKRYELDKAHLGWHEDITREPGPHSDAPYTVSFPMYWHSNETILLPNKGKGFVVEGEDVDQTVANYKFYRRTRIENGVLMMEASTKSLATEYPAADAPKAAEALKTMSDVNVYVRVPYDYQGTAADYESVLKQNPKTALDYITRANVYLVKKQFALSLEAISRAIILEPKNETALSLILSIHSQMNNEKLARVDIDKILSINPKNKWAKKLLYFYDLQKQKPEQAISTLNDMLAETPDDASLLSQRAQAYYKTNDYDHALSDSNAALRLDPKDNDIYLMRANIFMRRGAKNKVIEEAEALIKANPKDEYAYTYAGTMLISAGKQAEGFQALETSIAIKPTTTAYLTRANKRLKADYAGRLADINAALKLEPHSPDALAMKAQIDIDNGHFKEAIITYVELLKLDPGNDPIRLRLAIAFAKTKQSILADNELSVLRSNYDHKNRALNYLCWELAMADVKLEKALTYCDASIAIDNHYTAVLDSRGFVLLRLDRFDDAIKAYDEVLKIDPKETSSLYGRGIAHLRLHQDEAGQKDLQASRAIDNAIDARFKGYGVTP